MAKIDKDLTRMPRLFDVYGGLLTPHQRELFDLYYHHDLSLAEIAEMKEISRQGARDAISHAQDALVSYEDALGFCDQSEICAASVAVLNQSIQELQQIIPPRGEALLASMAAAVRRIAAVYDA